MPYLPGAREYRSFAASNFQPVVREPEDTEPSYKVRGYWTTFNEEYELYPAMPSIGWPAQYEQIDSHALDDADMSDVIFQENHEDSPLARMRNGSLEVGVDEHGAWCVADLGGCQRGRELYESICNGLVVEMSFGFAIADDEDGKGYVTLQDEQGDYHTTITRISRVYDCSAVSIPANPFTDVSEMRKRSYLAATIEADLEKLRKDEEQRVAEEAAAAEAEERAAAEAAKARRMRRARAMRLSSI